MAQKAKRRGRPPGAKSPDKMDIDQLRQYIDNLEGLLKQKVSEQRAWGAPVELTKWKRSRGRPHSAVLFA